MCKTSPSAKVESEVESGQSDRDRETKEVLPEAFDKPRTRGGSEMDRYL